VRDFSRNKYQEQSRDYLKQKRSPHAAVIEAAERSFSGQARGRAREGGGDGGDKLLPSRRPLDQQLGRFVKLADGAGFELERLRQNLIKTVCAKRAFVEV
jgi:hypothetical protein